MQNTTLKVKNTWNEYGKRTANAAKIDAGLFMHIPGWETGQTIVGNIISHSRNITGGVDNVEINHWTVLVNNNVKGGGSGGLTLGPYINGKNLHVGTDLYKHEYGHTIQSRILGPLYLTKVAIPSGISAFVTYDIQHDYSNTNYHGGNWYEVWANKLGKTSSSNPKYRTSYRTNKWWYWYLIGILPFAPM